MMMHLDTICIKGWYFHPRSFDYEFYSVYYDEQWVGAVRLKSGILLAAMQLDNYSNLIYRFGYEDKMLNSFETQVDRMYHLNLIAYQFDKRMQELSYGYS